ncbi:MAG: Wzz/FepE/Etk N-terminal domain-containing protein, partial [Candidatus Binataceae bacterium]
MPGRQLDEDYVDLRPYLRALRERWRMIAVSTGAAVVIAGIMSAWALPKWYRATAVIRPISTPAVESRIAGFLGGLGGGALGGGALGGLAASLGGAGGSSDAEEYTAILRGFQFNIALVQHHQLSGKFLRPLPWPLSMLDSGTSRDPRWKSYRTLMKRFDCEYSIKTGNITIRFTDRKREDAEKILGYYIDDLRDLLRAREISGASAAIASLKEE